MRESAASIDPVASIVQKLGVLLESGVAPASSWLYLAEQAEGPVAALLESVATAAREGFPVPGAIIDAIDAGGSTDADAWRGLAAAWRVATEVGAPLAPTLRGFSRSLRSLSQMRRDLRSALAGPVATARLVMVLPVVALVFGLALGFDTVAILVTTAPGLACLGAGLALMATARFWTGRLVAAASPKEAAPGLGFDLVAIAVSGGASLARAVAVVDEAREQVGLQRDTSEGALDGVLELSRRAGVPAAALLRSEADEARRVWRSEGDRRAATLAVTLMLPLGVCVLPAFLLLGVAPLLISVVASTTSPF